MKFFSNIFQYIQHFCLLGLFHILLNFFVSDNIKKIFYPDIIPIYKCKM